MVEWSTISAPSARGRWQAGGGEGIVNHRQRAVLAPDGADRGDVGQLQERVRRCFEPDQARGGAQRRRHALRVASVNKTGADALVFQHTLEKPVGTAVHIVAAEHVIARPQQGQGDGGFGGQAGGEAQAVRATFERGEGRFQRGASGVAGAGIVVALVHAHGFLSKGAGLVNRDDHRASGGVGFLTGVDGAGGKTVVGHRRLRGCNGPHRDYSTLIIVGTARQEYNGA